MAQEAEGGVMVLDLARHRPLLDVTGLLSQPNGHWQKGVLAGDKEAFRYTFLLLRQPFHLVTVPPGSTGFERRGEGAFERNGVAQFFGGYETPVFFRQMMMNDPAACGTVAHPDLAKRPHAWTYCARTHSEWPSGIDVSASTSSSSYTDRT
jgi:hypothetical protein